MLWQGRPEAAPSGPLGNVSSAEEAGGGTSFAVLVHAAACSGMPTSGVWRTTHWLRSCRKSTLSNVIEGQWA